MAKKQQKSGKPNLDPKAIIEELKTPGLIILGMVGGNMAGKMIDKVTKVDPEATGFQVKALLKPVVQISVGVGGALFLKDKNMKLIASGVAASGIASGVKVFLKKDILQGLTNFAGLGDSDSVSRVFREPVNLSIEPYNPELPKLLPAQFEAIPVENEYEINGAEMGAYTEVKEVEIL